MRIEKTQLEFDEIFKGKVKPIATGGYIPFFKKFIGRIVHIIIPLPEKAYWLFKKEDLIILKKAIEKMEFPSPYAKQRKQESLNEINQIIKKPENFDFELLKLVVENLEGEKLDTVTKNLLLKIKKSYSI